MSESEKKPMMTDIRAIITLLAAQCMIHLGEIDDPLARQRRLNLAGASLFIDLLTVLQDKTVGNLSVPEEKFLKEAIDNLREILKKKQV
jgi:hypothetical protein